MNRRGCKKKKKKIKFLKTLAARRDCGNPEGPIKSLTFPLRQYSFCGHWERTNPEIGARFRPNLPLTSTTFRLYHPPVEFAARDEDNMERVQGGEKSGRGRTGTGRGGGVKATRQSAQSNQDLLWNTLCHLPSYVKLTHGTLDRDTVQTHITN